MVFGQVVDGYATIKAAEACGSGSGSTSFDVMIRDCGQVPKGSERGVLAAGARGFRGLGSYGWASGFTVTAKASRPSCQTALSMNTMRQTMAGSTSHQDREHHTWTQMS